MRTSWSILAAFVALVAAAPARSPINVSAPAASPSGGKLVVAHMMVGNTYPYTADSWAKDIALAHASGIDGFALNIGSDSWQADHIHDAYTAAQASGTGFKLFFSFDMSVLPCDSPAGAATLRNYVTTYANHPAQLRVNDKAFVSTFAGETCTFGQGSVGAGWASQFKNHPGLSGENAIHFSPSFFVDPARYASQFGDVLDGAFSFNSGWPINASLDTINSWLAGFGLSLSNIPKALIELVSSKLAQFVDNTDSDSPFTRALASMGSGKTYMAAVSPWFFTHYGSQSWNKNWIYLADNHLYAKRWESLVQKRANIDIVQIVTWNDYGESHYLRDPGADAAQPASGAWVDGMSHAGWLDMTSYYAQAFKTGSYPKVEQDKVYVWARPHSRDASASGDGVGKPTNYQMTQDVVWAVVFATASGKLTINSRDFTIKAGANKLSVPISVGQGIRAILTRDGATVVDVRPDFTFSGSPSTYNYNAFVAYGAASP